MILYFGMDVHTTNFTITVMEPKLGFKDGGIIHETRVLEPDVGKAVKMAKEYEKRFEEDTQIIFGYEAGCLGFYIKSELKKRGYDCIVIAPSSIPVSTAGRFKKNDKMDSKGIARCLSQHNYSEVYMPTEEQIAISEYIRMRSDAVERGVKLKQQVTALVHRHGYHYPGTSNWTKAHFAWLDKLSFSSPIQQEVFESYMIDLRHNEERIQEYDKQIEIMSQMPAYASDVGKLCCFLGIKHRQALTFITEIGDFNRFAKPDEFASFLGLVPRQNSSGEKDPDLSITKAGNKHLRETLIESSQGICKGVVGKKSKVLKKRQEGQDAAVIAYADKANLRLRKKYYRLIHAGKARNTAVTAVARELACFICGMMQGKYDGAKGGNGSDGSK